MQRPTAVTVFGILNIVFAAFGLFGVLASVLLFTAFGANSNNPVLQIVRDSPAYAAWMKFSVVQGLVASGVLLAAGIGLLMLKPWARILSIAYGIYAILMILVGTVVNYLFLVQPMMDQARGMHGPEMMGAMSGAVGSMFGSCFGLIYPILLLIFMTRQNVAAAFRRNEP
jgi:hypothetical protein